jgi:hypothetical protein
MDLRRMIKTLSELSRLSIQGFGVLVIATHREAAQRRYISSPGAAARGYGVYIIEEIRRTE